MNFQPETQWNTCTAGLTDVSCSTAGKSEFDPQDYNNNNNNNNNNHHKFSLVNFKEIQVKIVLRFCLTLVRMIIVRNTTGRQCWEERKKDKKK